MKLTTVLAALAAMFVFVQSAQAHAYHHRHYAHYAHHEVTRHAWAGHRYAGRQEAGFVRQPYAAATPEFAQGSDWGTDWYRPTMGEQSGWQPGADARRADAGFGWQPYGQRQRTQAHFGWQSHAYRQRAASRLAWRTPAYSARPSERHANWARVEEPHASWRSSLGAEPRVSRAGLGPRPAAWCGWEMRQLVGGDPGPSYNLARNWAHWGHAGPPGIGAVVVWPHHVGKIVGQQNGRWVVESGNDGNRVRTRPLSTAGAIAFRWG